MPQTGPTYSTTHLLGEPAAVVRTLSNRADVAPPTPTARGAVSPGRNALSASAPIAALSAFMGAAARLVPPAGAIGATATGTSLVSGEVTAPPGQLAAAATFSGAVRINAAPLMASLIGYGGMLCSVSLTGKPTVYAQATSGSVVNGTATPRMARLELFAVTGGGFSAASVTAPMGEMGRTLQGWVAAPAGRLVAIGSAVVEAAHEAYAINLKHPPAARGQPPPTDEVTRYSNFPFRFIVRHQNSYYGVNDTGLYLLEGTTDDGEPIPWAIQTATEDFGDPRMKTVTSVLFGGRLGPQSEVHLLAGEESPVTYSHSTPRGQLAQNHRQVFGRGVRSRYFALGASGEGAVDLDTIELSVQNTTRRI